VVELHPPDSFIRLSTTWEHNERSIPQGSTARGQESSGILLPTSARSTGPIERAAKGEHGSCRASWQSGASRWGRTSMRRPLQYRKIPQRFSSFSRWLKPTRMLRCGPPGRIGKPNLNTFCSPASRSISVLRLHPPSQDMRGKHQARGGLSGHARQTPGPGRAVWTREANTRPEEGCLATRGKHQARGGLSGHARQTPGPRRAVWTREANTRPEEGCLDTQGKHQARGGLSGQARQTPGPRRAVWTREANTRPEEGCLDTRGKHQARGGLSGHAGQTPEPRRAVWTREANTRPEEGCLDTRGKHQARGGLSGRRKGKGCPFTGGTLEKKQCGHSQCLDGQKQTTSTRKWGPTHGRDMAAGRSWRFHTRQVLPSVSGRRSGVWGLRACQTGETCT